MSAPFNRRQAASRFASWLAASPLRAAQQLAGEPAGRIAPMGELANTFEFGAMAERQLGSTAFARIADSDRRGFDRMTLRPRMMVNALNLDLTCELFGEKMYTPILVGPIAAQGQYHPDGEVATVQGASAAKTVMVVSSRSSRPLEQIVASSRTTVWYQVYPQPDMHAARTGVERAVDLGCKAICITVGSSDQFADGATNPPVLAHTGQPGMDWNGIDRLRQGLRVPVLLKGIMSAEEARTAVERGISGIVLSHQGVRGVSGLAAPIELLPSITEAVGGKVPTLIDGGFRRGTDIVKGLALGARAILLGRPAMWGLAAYGAAGVSTLLKMLQLELARDMAMCGCVTMSDFNRNLVAIHRR